MLVLVLAVSLSTPLPPSRLHGRVVDPEARPVRDARVLVVCGSSVEASTITNGDGAFDLDATAARGCELRVAAEGLSGTPLPLDPNATDLGTISLAVSAIAEDVVVSAAQVEVPISQTPSAVTVITGAELRARQLTTIADALREIPGLSVVRTGTAGAVTSVFPRGGESDYSLVFVNGIEANTFGGGFDFAHLSADDVERVEIVRGPQSALYGSNAIGAVIRIVTREAGPVRADASLEFEPERVHRSVPASDAMFRNSRFSASTSGSRGNWFWGAGVEHLASAGLDAQRAADGEIVDNDDYARSETGASGGWRGERGAMVRGEVRFERDERGFPGPFGSNPIGAFAGIDRVSRGVDDRWLGSVGGTLPSGSRVHTTGQVTWNTIDSDFASPFGPSTSSSRRWTARGQTDMRLTAGLDASAGIELQREQAKSTYITNDAGDGIPVKRTVAGYFGELRWQPRPRFSATGGARLEDIRRQALAGFDSAYSPRPPFPEDRVVSVNPRVAVAWYARPETGTSTRLRAAAGTGIRPPDAFEIAFTDNPSLKPERSRSVEGGVDQAFASGHALVEATVFHNTFDDLIVATGPFTGVSRFRTDNISNARANGLELGGTFRARPRAMGIDARLTYTFLSSEILSVDRASAAPPPFTVGDPLLRRPRQQWSADVTGTRGRATLWLRGGGRGRTLDVEPSEGTFGGLFYANGYAVWNAGGAWKLVRGAEVFGRIDNLADRRYEEALGFPASGRAAIVGLRIAASR
jgi:outer membrane cobalamin receptor